MLKRTLEDIISKRFFTGKTVLLLGARQVGKTTLLKQFAKSIKEKIIWLNGDNPEDRLLLNGLTGLRAKQIFPKGSVVFIDEAQRIENTGLTLKIIHDNCPGIQMVVTGSSSFELTDKLKESMTGRKLSYKLYPISFSEILANTDYIRTITSLESRLLYGSYPEVINNAGNEKEVLFELVSDYLYKDIFSLKDVRKPVAIETLTKALAFQVGNQVSFRELSQLTKLDKETVERYIRILEEAFIVFRLESFSRNQRNELKFSKKIYFVDLGVRNALVNQFSPIELRNDVEGLWENYLISERMKKIEYEKAYRSTYFWRTVRQQEIDYIEEYDGKLHAYEFKWGEHSKLKIPKTFTNAYPDAEIKLINRENYFEFLL